MMATQERNVQEHSILEPWRYVVLMSNFGVRFLLVGLMKSYGVLIPFLVVQLQTSYATIGFIVTSQLALSALLSPLANLLMRKLNSRLVVVGGSCVASFALLSTIWARESWSMGLCMILSGSCFSVLMQHMVVTLRQHYREYFGFANTVTHIGSVIGTLVIPFFTMKMYVAYGLYGTLSCLGALSLHVIPFSMTLKPPRLLVGNRRSREAETESPRLRLEAPGTTSSESEAVAEYSKSGRFPQSDTLDSLSTSSFTFKHERNISKSDCDKKRYSAERSTNVSSSEDSEEEEHHTLILASKNGSIDSTRQENDRSECVCQNKDHSLNSQTETGETSQHIYRKLLTYVLEALVYDSLRKELTFSLTLLPCRFIMDISYIGWLIFMVSYAISVGVEASRAVYLPLAASAGGLAARICTGILLLWRPHQSPAVFVSLTTLSTSSLFFCTINSSLVNLVSCSFLSGFGLFGATSIYYAMLAEVVAEENFPGVLAMSYSCTGLGIFLSGLLTGLIYDIRGSFIFVFRVLGLFMAITTSMSITFLCCRARRHTRLSDKGEMASTRE